MPEDAKQCPWCARWCLKDTACNYIFACGLQSHGGFMVGAGCGKSWCWQCGKKFCGLYMNPLTGVRLSSAKDNHDANCCKEEAGYLRDEYCVGGHNSHCNPR